MDKDLISSYEFSKSVVQKSDLSCIHANYLRMNDYLDNVHLAMMHKISRSEQVRSRDLELHSSNRDNFNVD